MATLDMCTLNWLSEVAVLTDHSCIASFIALVEGLPWFRDGVTVYMMVEFHTDGFI